MKRKSNKPSYWVVWVTCGSKTEASKIASAVIREGLAACVNVIHGVRSIYWWRGKICQAREVLLVMKTTKARYAHLEKRIKQLHSYTVPEIIALSLVAGQENYLRWLLESTRMA